MTVQGTTQSTCYRKDWLQSLNLYENTLRLLHMTFQVFIGHMCITTFFALISVTWQHSTFIVLILLFVYLKSNTYEKIANTKRIILEFDEVGCVTHSTNDNYYKNITIN